MVKELCAEMGLVREYAEYGLFTLFRKGKFSGLL